MKILFKTENRDAASTLLFQEHLEFLAQRFSVELVSPDARYGDVDLVLFMGYDPDFDGVQESGSSARVGVVDPRKTFDIDLKRADFVIANGLEVRDWCLDIVSQVHIHYLYPLLSESTEPKRDRSLFRVGYHGNAIHINEMRHRIVPALNQVAERISVELILFYNIEALGRHDALEEECGSGVRVRHEQFESNRYAEVLGGVDVGIVPNLIPVDLPGADSSDEEIAGCYLNPTDHPHAHPSDFLLRFKSSSNPGRIFVFAQLQVPVIVDLFPSALQVVRPEVDGFICHSQGAWAHAFERLSIEDGLREQLGRNLHQRYVEEYSPEQQAVRLYAFFKSLLDS